MPRDRRHGGRVWTRTGRLGTRQVCRRGRDGPRPPSEEIAHGYESVELKTKDGVTIQGVLIKEGDPLMMRSMGGITKSFLPAALRRDGGCRGRS